MLFACEGLAARIERAEARMVADAALRVARRLPAGATFVKPLAGGFAICTEVGSPLTKVAGVLGRPLPAEPAAAADDLGIERAGADAGDAWLDRWLDVVVTGFATPDTRGVPSDEEFPRDVLEGIMRDFASTDGMATYLANLDGEPAGGASMRCADGVALLCGAATLPRHRRRGVQTELLSRRLADAAVAGCDVAVATTQPGSTSQQNVQRRGFDLLYARAVLVREGG